MFRHPTLNSIIVQSNQSRAGNRSAVTPTNEEGRKLDVLGCHLYLLASFVMRVSNYQATMGAYHRQLWNKSLPILQTAPGDVRTASLNTHLEAINLAKQCVVAHHTADAASKSLVSSIILSKHGCGLLELQMMPRSALRNYLLTVQVFSMKKPMRSWRTCTKSARLLVPMPSSSLNTNTNQWHKPFTYQQSYQHPYRPYKPLSQTPERSGFTQAASAAPP